jgi:hypothetical protein
VGDITESVYRLLLVGVKRRIVGGMEVWFVYVGKSNRNDPAKHRPDFDHQKGKKEIYLGLEKVAVTENATHDEETKWEWGMSVGCLAGKAIYISIKALHRIRPISVLGISLLSCFILVPLNDSSLPFP